MPDKQAKENQIAKRGLSWVLRAVSFFLVASAFTFVLNYSSRVASERREPAGFLTGLLHGALMPGAMPNLLLGRDVPIYAERNNGRLYKLGYTTGVNGCGALFFGLLYYRFNRWRKRRNGNQPQPSQ